MRSVDRNYIPSDQISFMESIHWTAIEQATLVFCGLTMIRVHNDLMNAERQLRTEIGMARGNPPVQSDGLE
jgi:hypothetical protein